MLASHPKWIPFTWWLQQVYGDEFGNFTAGAGLLVANFQGTGLTHVFQDAQTSHICTSILCLISWVWWLLTCLAAPLLYWIETMTSHASPKLSRAWVDHCRSDKAPVGSSYWFLCISPCWHFDMSLSQVAFGTQVCTEISWSLCLTARMLVTCWAYFPTRVKELVSSTWIVDSLHWTLVAFGIRFLFPFTLVFCSFQPTNLWIYCLGMFPVRELTYCHIAFIIEVIFSEQHTWPTLLVKFSRHFPSFPVPGNKYGWRSAGAGFSGQVVRCASDQWPGSFRCSPGSESPKSTPKKWPCLRALKSERKK